MNIVHVIETLDPKWGGPPFVCKRLAAAQASQGHDVTLLSRAEPPGVRELVAKSLSALPGASGVRVAWDGGSQLPAGAELVHLHGVWDPELRRGAGAARRRGVPYVVTPHGMLDPWSLAQKRWKKRLGLALYGRRLLNGASFIHALNADEERLMRPVGLTAPCCVIPNGVFLEEIEPLPEPGAFHAAHPELGGRPYILFLGRLHYKKGLDLLAGAVVRIAASLPDLQVVVVGEDWGAREPFIAQIDAAGLSGRTHVLGPMYGRQKVEVLQDAACFCLPSRQEGFSVAILEALACGVPVVISTECHFPEVAEAGVGRVIGLDTTTLAAALEAVLSDDAARAEMGRRGRALVLERYTWPAIAELCLAAYARCA